MAILHGSNNNENNTRQGFWPFDVFISQLDGSGSDDEIYGLAGDDIILGNAGDDVIYGDRSSSSRASIGFHGRDTLRGGSGNDVIHGDGGDDQLYGEADNDQLFGGDGNDRLYGGSNSGGIDRLFGDAGNDLLYGDDSETVGGTDHLFGGSGDDKLYGRAGNDLLQGQSSSSLLSVFEKDELTGGLGTDTFVVSGLYRHGGNNDYAAIKDWNQGGAQDRLDVANPNAVQIFAVDSNTFNVYQVTEVGGFFGGTSSELVARIDSNVLSGQALFDNISANLV
jgi:Ca2+-binding RTX toxin-like protein